LLRRLLLCTLLLAAALALPASAASAASFFVDGAAAPGGNCSQLTPCQTIGAAVSAERGTVGEADTIHVAPGLYEEYVELMNTEDTGLTIEGAGSGSDPATDTIVRAGGYLTLVLGGPSYEESHMTVRNLRVEAITSHDDENDQQRGAGLIVNASDSLLENVHVEVPAPGGTPVTVSDPAVEVRQSRVTLDHVVARIPGGGQGVYADADDLVVRDSDIYGGGSGLEVRSDGDLLLQRSHIAADQHAEYALRTQGTLTADSSLLTGGSVGLLYFGGAGGSDRVDAVLRNLTIDAGLPGVIDPLVVDETPDYGGMGISLQGAGADLDSSIVLEKSVTYGGQLRCHSSDVRDQVEGPTADNSDGSILCGTGYGNEQGNSSSTPAALFADSPGGDWRLRADSPARDHGTSGALSAGESTTDLAGAPRVLDSNRDCVARRDQGAYELTGAAGCPAAPGPVVAAPLPDVVAPVFGTFSLTRKSFAVSGRRTAVAAKVARGTVLRWSLSEPAQVKITIQRLVRKRGRLRAVRAGVLRRSAPSGAYRLAFSGRIGRKALKPGRYRLRVVATDKAGNVSKQRRVNFRIVAP
jgi:hypothetical protein